MAVFTQTIEEILATKPADIARDTYLGLDAYPINTGFDRTGLNDMIVNHYMMREIGFETLNYFTFKMKVKLNEIMPKYNLLLKTQDDQWAKVFQTISINTTGTGSSTEHEAGASTNHAAAVNSEDTTSHNEADSTSDSNSTNKGRVVVSSTPQVQLSGNGAYATGLTDSNGEGTQHNTGTQTNDGTVGKNGTNTVDGTASDTLDRTNANTRDGSVLGYNGIPAKLVQAYRDSVEFYQTKIVFEVGELFMSIWENGDDQYIKFPKNGYYI